MDHIRVTGYQPTLPFEKVGRRRVDLKGCPHSGAWLCMVSLQPFVV